MKPAENSRIVEKDICSNDALSKNHSGLFRILWSSFGDEMLLEEKNEKKMNDVYGMLPSNEQHTRT